MNNEQNPIIFQSPPNQTKKSHWKSVLVTLLLLILVAAVAFLAYLQFFAPTDNPTSTGTTSTATSTSEFDVDTVLSAVKTKLDSTTYAGLSTTTPSSSTYIIEKDDYQIATIGNGYTLTYIDDGSYGVNSASKQAIETAFPSIVQVYSDMQAVLKDEGLTIDEANTFNKQDDSSVDLLGARQVTAANDDLVCVVSPLGVVSYNESSGTYTIDIACSKKSLFTENQALQKQLVDAAAAKDSNINKATYVIEPQKQVGDFISANTSTRFLAVGGNRAIFQKKDNAWTFVTTNGQAVPACRDVDGIGIPTTILDTCVVDGTGAIRAPQS